MLIVLSAPRSGSHYHLSVTLNRASVPFCQGNHFLEVFGANSAMKLLDITQAISMTFLDVTPRENDEHK